MKTLAIILHGKKDGENVDKRQIIEIVKNGIPGLNELVMDHNGPILFHFGSKFECTKQTVKAFEEHLDADINYDFGGYLFPDQKLGNPEMFTHFLSDTKIKAAAEKTNWYDAFRVNDPQFLKETQKGLLEAVEQAFISSPEDSLIISACHTPMIEWLVLKLSPKNKISRGTQLKELTGFVITQEFGKITVSGTVGF